MQWIKFGRTLFVFTTPGSQVEKRFCT